MRANLTLEGKNSENSKNNIVGIPHPGDAAAVRFSRYWAQRVVYEVSIDANRL